MKYILLMAFASVCIPHYASVNNPNDLKNFEKFINNYKPASNNVSFNVNMQQKFPSIGDKKTEMKILMTFNTMLTNYLGKNVLNFNNTTNNIVIASALLAQARIIDLLDIMTKLFLKQEYYRNAYDLHTPISRLILDEKGTTVSQDPSVLITNDPQTFAMALQFSQQDPAVKFDAKATVEETINANEKITAIVEAYEIEINKPNIHSDAKKYIANRIIGLIRNQLLNLSKISMPQFFVYEFNILSTNDQLEAFIDVAQISNEYLKLKNNGYLFDIIPYLKETITLLCKLQYHYTKDDDAKKFILIDKAFEQVLTDVQKLIKDIEPFKLMYNALYKKIVTSFTFKNTPLKRSIITSLYDTLEQWTQTIDTFTMPGPELYAKKTSPISYQSHITPELQQYIEKEGKEKSKKPKKATSAKKTQTTQKSPVVIIEEQKIAKEPSILLQKSISFDTAICYDERIVRWFDSSFREGKNISSIIYHSYPIIADYYIKAFGIQSTYHSPSRKKDIDYSYIIGGYIQYQNEFKQEIKEHVIYVITFDPKGTCYHRGFSTKDFELIKKYYEHIDFEAEKKAMEEKFMPENIKEYERSETSGATDAICLKPETELVTEENDFLVRIDDLLNKAVIILYKPLKPRK